MPPWRNRVGIDGGGEVSFEQARHRDVLREDQHRAALGEDRAEQLVAQVELLRAALEPPAGLAQVVGGVVADLLEPGEQRQHQPAPGVLVGALDAVHRLAHQRLVEHHLLAGQADDLVGLGLRRQLGGDAGVGLAAAQQERLDQLGEPARHRRVDAALDRRGPHLAEGVARAEQARRRPVEDRPQLGQVVLHRGAGQRDPAARGRSCAGCGRSRTVAFLMCCASSATTRSHGTVAERPRGSSRIVPYVVSTNPSSSVQPRSRPVPWNRRTGDPGREPADLGLPVAHQAGRTDHQRRARSPARARAGAGAARSG